MGIVVGFLVGARDGILVGMRVGLRVGFFVGDLVGAREGARDGALVAIGVQAVAPVPLVVPAAQVLHVDAPLYCAYVPAAHEVQEDAPAVEEE